MYILPKRKMTLTQKWKEFRNYFQGDHGGLEPSFVDFDLICSSICPILLGQVKIRQILHVKWEN